MTKHLIVLIAFCLCNIVSFAQKKIEIVKIEMTAINFTDSYYIHPNLKDIKNRALFVRITNKDIIQKSQIPLFLSQMEIDNGIKAKIDNDPKSKKRYETEISRPLVRLILKVYYSSKRKETYYLTYGIFSLNSRVVKDKIIYKNNTDIYNACYAFFPADYYDQKIYE